MQVRAEAAGHPIDENRDIALLEELSDARRALEEQIGRRVVGQT